MNSVSKHNPISYEKVFVIIMSLVIQACSSDQLTRTKAKELVLTNNDYPREITTVFAFGTVQGGHLWKNYQSFVPELNESGLGQAKIVRQQPLIVDIALTENGSGFVRDKKYGKTTFVLDSVLGKGKYETYVASIVLYVVSFGEISGITYNNEEQTIAQVEYTEIYEPTPFASLNLPGGFMHKEPTSEVKATFRLYDDGWRSYKPTF